MNVAVTGREKLFVSIAIMTACTARIRPTAMFQMRSRLSLRSADWSTAILCLLFVNPILAKSNSNAEKWTTVVSHQGPLPLTYSEYFCAAIRTYFLSSWFAILHFYKSGNLDFHLLPALHAVCLQWSPPVILEEENNSLYNQMSMRIM